MMSVQATVQPQMIAKPAFTPITNGILQRACACGQHTASSGGECEECKKKRQVTLQRAAVQSSSSISYGTSNRVIQTKLTINKPGDEYEQEANRIADQVMSVPVNHPVSNTSLRIQRFSHQSGEERETAPTSVDQALASPGSPLERSLRQDMEKRFGYDFSQVRVHTGATAEQSAREVNAHAYTVGNHVVFGLGQFTPRTHDGRRLLAHELTHTIQQSSPFASTLHARQSTSNETLGTLAQNPGIVLQRVPTPTGASTQATAILPEFANKTEGECREIVGDIYVGDNTAIKNGILDHKIDAVYAMQDILDKKDVVKSRNVNFFLGLITDAAAWALGKTLGGEAAKVIIWAAKVGADSAKQHFDNERLLDAVEFCQEYLKSLRMDTERKRKEVKSQITGTLTEVRVAASAFRRIINDKDKVAQIKLNQEQEVADLWTNAVRAEKERRKGQAVEPGKISSTPLHYQTAGRIILIRGLIKSWYPHDPENHTPERWVESPRTAVMPGVPEGARKKYLNRKIGEVPVERIMIIVAKNGNVRFAVAMAPDHSEWVQVYQPDFYEEMKWVLTSFVLDKILLWSDESKRLVESNWKRGVAKCWDQVRNRTFAELGIKSIESSSGWFLGPEKE